MYKKRISTIILSAVTAISLVACAGQSGGSQADTSSQAGQEGAGSTAPAGSGGTPTIYVAMPQSAGQDAQVAWTVERLEAERTDVNIEFDIVVGDEQNYATKIRTLLSAGAEELDLWWDRGGSFVIPIFEANAALAIDGYIEGNQKFWNAVVPGMMKPSDDGKYYAIPCEQMNWEVVYYNMRVLDAQGLSIPETVEEFYALCQALLDSGMRPIAIRGKPGWPVAMAVEGFAYTMDPQVTYKIANGEETFDCEPYRMATDVMKTLLDMDAFTENAALDNTDECLAQFLADEAAIWFNISSQIPVLANEMGEDIQWTTYPVMREEDKGNFMKNCAGGLKPNSGSLVNANTKHPQLSTDVAVDLSIIWSQYYYEVNGSPYVPYDPEALGWQMPEGGLGATTLSLADAMGTFAFTYPFVQDVMPSSAGTAMLMETANRLISDKAYSAGAFIDDWNQALAEE